MDPMLRSTPVDINFSGPVAMLAKRYLAMQGVNATIPQILGMIKENPALAPMLDKIDPDGLAQYIFDTGGVPQVILRDDKIVAQIREQRNQAMQAQQKQQAMGNMADAYQKAKDAPEEGSPAEQQMKGQQ
jgi:hypothetical protein